MASCSFCHEKDESRLVMSVKAVNGRIIYDRDVCLACLFKSHFAIKILGEDGKAVSAEREAFERTESARGIQVPKL